MAIFTKRNGIKVEIRRGQVMVSGGVGWGMMYYTAQEFIDAGHSPDHTDSSAKAMWLEIQRMARGATHETP